MHLSWSPRAFYIKGLMSDEEADHLIKLVSCWGAAAAAPLAAAISCPPPVAAGVACQGCNTPCAGARLTTQATPQMEKSGVVDSNTGQSKDSDVSPPPPTPKQKHPHPRLCTGLGSTPTCHAAARRSSAS